MITIVGLGRNRGDLTENGKRAVESADGLYVRTLLSEAGKQVKPYAPVSMDELYESCADFDTLFTRIADRVLKADGPGRNIVYCVDGDGFFDSSVLALQEKTDKLQFIAGVSDGVPARAVSGLQIFCAQDLAQKPFRPDSSFPLIVKGLTDRYIAGDAKLWLLRFYGGDATVLFAEKQGFASISLFDLDRQKKYDHRCYAFIPAQSDFNKPRYGYADLMRIMTRLIAPDGCPWDRAQTHASIAKNATEEAGELVEAIASGDIDNLEEECGDVVLQGIFHGFIGEKYGEFTADDVINRLCQKLVFRHTHIFGENKAENPDEALAFWQEAKRREKESKR